MTLTLKMWEVTNLRVKLAEEKVKIPSRM